MTVVIYGTSTCNWCDRAVELAHQYSLEVEYKSLDDRFEGATNLAEFREKLPNVKTVPQIFWNGNHLGGFNEFAAEIENTRNFGQEKL